MKTLKSGHFRILLVVTRFLFSCRFSLISDTLSISALRQIEETKKPMKTDTPKKRFSMIREFQLADWFTLSNAVCGTGVYFSGQPRR